MSNFNQEQRDHEDSGGKMFRQGLTDLVLALLHVVGPCHRSHGGRCQCRPVLTLARPPPSSPSAVPHHRVLEWRSSPSPDRSAYRLMEPSDLDASPWCHQGRSCVIHGWEVATDQGPSSSSRQEEGEEEDDDECRITVVAGPTAIRRTTCISVGPRGRP
jgi:hypothetical protein